MAKRNSTNPINFNKSKIYKKENGEIISENDNKPTLNNKQIAEQLYGDRLKLRGKNKKQIEFIKEIEKKEIIFAVGPAGVGKSYISVAKALELLANPENNYQKIYVITPAIEADNSIGFLKGTLEDKLEPYLFSTYYIIDKLIGKMNRKKMQELHIIEPLAYGFIHGISIDNAIVIAEESQNTGISQMKSLLTRIGFNSKFIISGDLEQIFKKNAYGLQDGIAKTSNIDEVGLVEFSINDIVRNPLITKILNNYS